MFALFRAADTWSFGLGVFLLQPTKLVPPAIRTTVLSIITKDFMCTSSTSDPATARRCVIRRCVVRTASQRQTTRLPRRVADERKRLSCRFRRRQVATQSAE